MTACDLQANPQATTYSRILTCKIFSLTSGAGRQPLLKHSAQPVILSVQLALTIFNTQSKKTALSQDPPNLPDICRGKSISQNRNHSWVQGEVEFRG